MELFFMILSLLYLTRTFTCFQISPSLSVKTPVDFELEINGNLFSNEPKGGLISKNGETEKPGLINQCFCLPSDPRNQLVTDFLGPKDDKLERLVVFLYNIDGTLKTFIPSKQKQNEIPDLTYDLKGGDILKPLDSLDTVAKIFEGNPNILSRQPQNLHSEEKDVSMYIDTSASIDTQPELSDNNDKMINAPMEIIESIVEEMSDMKQSDEITFDNVIPFNEQNKPIVDLLVPSVQEPFNINPGFENINVNINKIPSHMSLKPIQSLPHMTNPSLDILQNDHLKFNNWLNNQLSHVVLDNSGKDSNADEVRKRIQDVLINKGMFISSAGVLFDSSRNILNMSNIMLRTILIGEPVDSHAFNHETGQISYLQMILIVSIDPPELLGVVPTGKVFLPRKVNKQNIEYVKNQNDGKLHFLRLSPRLGCINCKSRRQQNTESTEQADIQMNEVPFFELPLRRSFANNDNRNTFLQSFHAIPSDKFAQTESRTTTTSNTDLSGILQNLLGILGPNLFSEQTRRLLGGTIFRNDKSSPKGYVIDNSDYRIIGGKPATSSGVPLVSKGRSGYEYRF